MRNTAEHLFVWLALMRVGAILVAANPAASEAEVNGLIDQTKPKLVVDDAEEHLRKALELAPPTVEVLGDTLRTFANPADHRVALPELPVDLALVPRLAITACGTAYYAGMVGKLVVTGGEP